MCGVIERDAGTLYCTGVFITLDRGYVAKHRKLTPTADERDQWQSTMRHIALEGRCFVIGACWYLTRDAMPDDVHPVQGGDPATVLIGGGSVIISPLGDVLAGPSRGGECLVTADLDVNDLARSKFDFDAVGHYARPDVFTLSVDENAHHSATRRG